MDQAAIEWLLTVLVVAGMGLCLVYGAQAMKVQFSLSGIFVMVTTLCVALAGFAMFGSLALELTTWLLLAIMPAVNLMVVGVLIITVIHTRNEPQAVAIGRLVPLLSLAIADTVRLAATLTSMQSGWPWLSFVTYLAAYLTSLGSGLACREVFRRVRQRDR